MADDRTTAYAEALFAVARAEGPLAEIEDELFRVAQVVRGNDELRDKLISMGFLQESDEGMGGGFGGLAPATRTVAAESLGEDGEELGPVAKALLEALKESGREGLLPGDEDDEDEEE